MKKLFLWLALLLCTGMAAIAQQPITGQVSDAQTGDPLPGVSVIVKGTQQGTSTDVDGNYSFSVPQDATLIFSFVGYDAQEIPVEGRTTINVSLQPRLEEIEEVVVIGYGQVRKEDATGSVAVVKSEDFDLGAITSPQELLSGKTTGVEITTAGGQPGAEATIRIRGGSSMSASNDPLIVIDGVALDNETVDGMRNPLNTIHPRDIESFTVLKDASATAIYGSRASNGVIIIETKKGQAGQPFRINYSGTMSFDWQADQIDVLNGDEFREVIQQRFGDNPNATALLGSENTDWQDQIFRNTTSHDHNLSFSGSIDPVPFRASVGYSYDEGMLLSTSMERTTASLGVNPDLLDDHLNIEVNAKGMIINNQFADEGAIGNALGFDPTQPVYDDNSPYGGYYTWVQDPDDPTSDPITIATRNPLAQVKMRDDDSDVRRFIGNAKLDYDLHFLPELNAVVNIGYDYSKSDGYRREPENAAWEYNEVQGGGIDRDYGQEKKNELLDIYLTYGRDIDAINSRVSLMGGYSWQHFWRKGFTYETNVAGTVTNQDTDYKTESYLLSYFGRLNYTFNDKYLFTATLRRDGSSRFSPDTRWGLFPSFALGWQLNEEPFIEKLDLFNILKLRLGYGVTGQQNITDNDYPYQSAYTFSESTAQYQLGDAFITTLRPEGYDENIKWEETATYNIGLDYGLFDNRVSGNIDFYYKKTDDLINTIAVPAGTNLTNRILTNVGDLENRGVEFAISGLPVSQRDFSWELGFNITYNKNEITKLTQTDDPNYQGVETGGIGGGVGNNIQIHTVGYPMHSFYVYEQVYDENGDPMDGLYVDQDGDGVITSDDLYRLEKADPDYFGGFFSRLSYKNWDFRFSGRFNIGNYVYNNVESNRNFYSSLYNAAGYLNNATTGIFDTRFTNARYFSDYYIQDGSFLRMDNVTLGYTFSDLLNQKVNVRLYGTLQNLFILTPYEGLDPEIEGGIDNNIYPRPTTFLLGLSVDF